MIKSMTGFGRGSAGRGQNKVEIEIRSVNSRYFELKLRGLKLDPNIEQRVRNKIYKNLIRGNIQIRINLGDNQSPSALRFNKDRYETIQNIINDIHVQYGQRLGLNDLITTSDLLISSDPDQIKPDLIFDAIDKCLIELNDMRLQEGKTIYDDILFRINSLIKTIDTIGDNILEYSGERQAYLQKKITKILESGTLDESRLHQEVAYLIERADINEEIVRCRSHFKQLEGYINDDQPVGKKINFLIQEIGREVNTIGAKSAKTEITLNVVEMKDELEKIREQAQNIL